MILSECCDAYPWGEIEYGICGDCKDHCEFYDDEDETPKECGPFSVQQQAIIDNIVAEVKSRCDL